MAKHIKGKFISKGIRTSSKPNPKSCTLDKNGLEVVRKVAKADLQVVRTAMRNAFENTKVTVKTAGGNAGKVIMNALSTKAGTRPVGRGWTANVSKRTLHTLQAQGVFA